MSDRIIELVNENGVVTEETTLKNVEVGYVYTLIDPITIIKKFTGSEEQERMTEVKIEKKVNRKLRKEYDKIKDHDKLADRMLLDLTSMNIDFIDELTDCDFYNLNQILSAFLPEPIIQIAEKNMTES